MPKVQGEKAAGDPHTRDPECRHHPQAFQWVRGVDYLSQVPACGDDESDEEASTTTPQGPCWLEHEQE